MKSIAVLLGVALAVPGASAASPAPDPLGHGPSFVALSAPPAALAASQALPAPTELTAVPEPVPAALAVAGLALLGLHRRRARD